MPSLKNMNKKILFVVGVIIIIGLVLFAIINITQNQKSDSSKISVVTTLFPLYDFSKVIGQDKVEVSLLLPPGVEAHVYEPKPSDIVKINESDIFVYTGEFMEPWAKDIINGITNKDVRFVDTSKGINLMKLTEGMPDEAHGLDPHIWLDFANNTIMVDNLLNAIIEKDPDNADFYKKNANDFKNKLTQLDDQYKSGLTNCQSKEIVYGGHYAFGYLANRYNLKYLAAQGLAPDSEPSANDLVNLTKQIKDNNIKYVFYEELTSPKIAQTLANETNAKMLLLNAAHNVTKEDIDNNVSFLSIMEENLNNLKIGLECNR